MWGPRPPAPGNSQRVSKAAVARGCGAGSSGCRTGVRAGECSFPAGCKNVLKRGLTVLGPDPPQPRSWTSRRAPQLGGSLTWGEDPAGALRLSSPPQSTSVSIWGPGQLPKRCASPPGPASCRRAGFGPFPVFPLVVDTASSGAVPWSSRHPTEPFAGACRVGISNPEHWPVPNVGRDPHPRLRAGARLPQSRASGWS